MRGVVDLIFLERFVLTSGRRDELLMNIEIRIRILTT